MVKVKVGMKVYDSYREAKGVVLEIGQSKDGRRWARYRDFKTKEEITIYVWYLKPVDAAGG